MSDISNMKIFVKVVEEGSFSAVSRSLGVTPSSISRQISQLEKELQARLFQRTTRKQSLTEAGKVYFQYANKLVQEMETAKLAVKRLTNKPSGLLRITAETDFALKFIEPILPKFLTMYSDIKISLEMSSSQQDLIDENLDLAIRVGHLSDSSLNARQLTQSHSVICASPSYLSTHGKPRQPHDLKLHNCLSFRTNIGINHWYFETSTTPIEVAINGSLNVNSLSFLRKAALKGLGIVMIPKWMISNDLLEQRLIPILQDFLIFQASTPIHAIFTNKKQLPPKTRVFIDFLIDNLNNME